MSLFSTRKSRVIAIIVLSILGVWFVIDRRSALVNTGSSGKPIIVTSFYPLYYFTTQIVGDKAEVYNITPAGAEPHDYEPTTADMIRIEDSRLLILNGVKLEAWGDKIKDTIKGSNTVVVEVGTVLAQQMPDPHIWLSPVLAKKEVAAILNQLKIIDPDNAATYQSDALKLEDELDRLHQEYLTGLRSCSKKVIITAHAAFGHLAREYGLRQVPIAGLSPDEEPSPQKLVEVAAFARKNEVTAIFFESLVSPKFSETIAHEIGAKTFVLNPIEGLSDTEIAAGHTYLTEMQANLATLKNALTCR